MNTFKEFLIENDFLTTSEEINRWIDLVAWPRLKLALSAREDGTVDALRSVTFTADALKTNGGRLPFMFNEAKSNFDVSECKLISLLGSPRLVSGHFNASDNLLDSLEGIPQIINGSINLSNNPKLKSLSGIHKKLKSVGMEFLIPETIKTGILSLMMVKELKSVQLIGPKVIPGLSDALKILNRHLRKDRDVLACQEELISAGFKEFAKL